MITKVAIGPLTQGTIFSCAVAEDYDGCEVHGLVITARCDAANDKAQVYNYVPVVKFDDWIVRDGARIIAARTSRAAEGELRNVLNQIGFAPSILKTTPRDVVLKTIFDAVDASAKIKGKRDQFVKHMKRCDLADRFHSEAEGQNFALDLIKSENVEAARIIRELCSNAIAEAYYISRVNPQEKGEGYVVLLREIRHVPRKLAHAIAHGLDNSDYAALCARDSRSSGRICIPHDGFAWPTGLLQSPYIEHLMQRLTILFSRIGVTDVTDADLKCLQERLPRG